MGGVPQYAQECDFRKPQTGLIRQTCEFFDIDLATLTCWETDTRIAPSQTERTSRGFSLRRVTDELILNSSSAADRNNRRTLLGSCMIRSDGLWTKGGPLLDRAPDSILIVKLSAIGDVVHTLPLLEVLRNNFPEARIDWVVEEEAAQIVAGHKALDRVFVSHRKSWQRRLLKAGKRSTTLKEIGRFIQDLRAREYDLVIDLQGLFKSGLWTGLSKGKRKIGLSDGREGSSLFLTEAPFPVDYSRHALERNLTVAHRLSCRENGWTGEIPFAQEDREAVDKLLQEEGLQDARIVALNPIARWKTKLWDWDRFAHLADMVKRAFPCEIVFTGSHSDQEITEKILALMKEKGKSFAGRTSLKELAYLYTRSALLICTDTGPMHIAAAMGCPVVALFGPTAPWRTGPYGSGHRVLKDTVNCSPCFNKKCDHMICMQRLTVEKVFETVAELL